MCGPKFCSMKISHEIKSESSRGLNEMSEKFSVNLICDGARSLNIKSKFNLKNKIRFGKYVKKANWSSSTNSWTIDVKDKSTGELSQISCNFIFTIVFPFLVK